MGNKQLTTKRTAWDGRGSPTQSEGRLVQEQLRTANKEWGFVKTAFHYEIMGAVLQRKPFQSCFKTYVKMWRLTQAHQDHLRKFCCPKSIKRAEKIGAWRGKRKQEQSSSGGCPPCLPAGLALHLCRIRYMDLGQGIHSYDFIEQSLLVERGC